MRKLPKPKKQHIAKLLLRHETCSSCVYKVGYSGNKCHCTARTYFNKKKRKWQYKPCDKRNICEWHRNRFNRFTKKLLGVVRRGYPSMISSDLVKTYPIAKPSVKINYIGIKIGK